jgi:hypothetical protein
MTYLFPQFKVEISNPKISVNLNTIQDKAIDKLLSVDVVLTTDSLQLSELLHLICLIQILGRMTMLKEWF